MCRAFLSAMRPHGLAHPVLVEKAVVGAGVRRNGRCPVCGAIDRERLAYLCLRHRTDLFTAKKGILHCAPRWRLRQVLEARPNLDYLSADLLREDCDIQLDLADASSLQSQSFDVVIANHVLEHIPDDRAAMREIFRLLRPGGFAMLQTPIAWSRPATEEDPGAAEADRITRFGQADHVRIYGADYVSRLEDVGFEVELFDWRSDPAIFGGETNRYSLIPEEKVVIARAP